MKISKKRYDFNILQILTLLLLFFSGVNIGNKYFYFCFLATVIFIALNKALIVDRQVIILLILALAWILFASDMQTFSLTSIIKPFLYPMAYMVGRSFLVNKNQSAFEIRQKLIVPILILLSAGPFVHYLLNFLTNLNSDNRNTIDIWTGTMLSATGQAALACMMLSISLAVLFISTKAYVKLISVGCLIIIFLYNLILSGRTLFMMTAFIVLIGVIYYLKELKGADKKIQVIGAILICACALFFAYLYNLFGIADYIEKSNMYLRFFGKNKEDVFSDTRMKWKMLYLDNFWMGIFGGAQIRKYTGKYAHDIFLDTYDEGGVVALFAMVYFIIRSVYVLIKCIKNKEIDFKFRFLMLSLYLSLYIEFLLEPILQGVPWLFALFCFIHGLIESFYNGFIKSSKSLSSINKGNLV